MFVSVRSFFRILLFLVLATGTLTACKSKRKLVVAETPPSLELLAWEKALTGDLLSNELSLAGELNGTFGGSQQSSAFNIRIERGKQIWMILRPMLGIEAFRMLITPDSLRIVDRLNRQYYEKPFSYLNQLAGTSIDYITLENLLLNNLGHLADSPVEPSKNPAFDFITSRDSILYSILLQPDQPKARQLEAVSSNKKVNIVYGPASLVDSLWVPSSIKAVLNGNENSGITLNFSKFAVENGQTYPYSIPKNYSRVD